MNFIIALLIDIAKRCGSDFMITHDRTAARSTGKEWFLRRGSLRI